MAGKKSVMSMLEPMVFARPLVVGFIIAEVLRAGFYVGGNIEPLSIGIVALMVTCGVIICFTYLYLRGAHLSASRIIQSLRLDLILIAVIGAWVNQLLTSHLELFHGLLKELDAQWPWAILSFLLLLLLSPIVLLLVNKKKQLKPQMYFVSDEEIDSAEDDQLATREQAEAFADTVLASDAHQGLIFGLEGPWGVGKTSFINLAQQKWETADNRVIVCRFEPLRFASERDLTDRLIQNLSAAIRRKVYAPEFGPAASRYSRLLKGKADFSFLGFRLALEPSKDTFDELLEDIDQVLKKIDRRVIVVVDDLDRLDPQTINNVLFATRRTFSLSQAAYVLCYDTEVLAGNSDDGEKAREFLEKFVTVKLSLFVDSSRIRDFLMSDWQSVESRFISLPSSTMVKLGVVLTGVAEILDDRSLAAKYLPFLGNMRKVKRFVNALLLVRIGETDIGMTDFDSRDLINLMLLHLNYPGVFRKIYAEETQERQGSFSVSREFGQPDYKNSEEFEAILKQQPEGACFLLRQLFDVEQLNLGPAAGIEEVTLASRACFNDEGIRNLEQYLNLIVHFTKPEPQDTFVLYQQAVNDIISGKLSFSTILSSEAFNLENNERGQHAHDHFWRILVNQANRLSYDQIDKAIKSLIQLLPHYSSVNNEEICLRHRSIYSLLRLLDRSFSGTRIGQGKSGNDQDFVEIRNRIFGEGDFANQGIIECLCRKERGVLGWVDVMIFRLQCSADRQGQLYQLHGALIRGADSNAPLDGPARQGGTVAGMRRLSQRIFLEFKKSYIEAGNNFFTKVCNTRHEDYLGSSLRTEPSTEERISRAKSFVKSFVIYQLANNKGPEGAGVGCGFYDEQGSDDNHGIANIMNKYIFDFCFDPDRDVDNILHFFDHCLSHLTNAFFTSDFDQEGYIPTKKDLPGGLDPLKMGQYWKKHRDKVIRRVEQEGERSVSTGNYTLLYKEGADSVIKVLDEIAEEGGN